MLATKLLHCNRVKEGLAAIAMAWIRVVLLPLFVLSCSEIKLMAWIRVVLLPLFVLSYSEIKLMEYQPT